MKSDSEVYKLNEQSILLLTYVSGNDKYDIGMGKVNVDAEKTKAMDAPHAFFESLRKQ